MNKTPVTRIDADMGYRPGGQAEKQQVTRLQAGLMNRAGMAKLCACCPRDGYSCLAIGVVHQATAIESAWTGAAVMIGNAKHAGGDIKPFMPDWLLFVFCSCLAFKRRVLCSGCVRLPGRSKSTACSQDCSEQDDCRAGNFVSRACRRAGSHVMMPLFQDILYIGLPVCGLSVRGCQGAFSCIFKYFCSRARCALNSPGDRYCKTSLPSVLRTRSSPLSG